MAESFSPAVIRKLKFYVYRLIDPRNGETFYVGKGKGNRVFDHAADSLKSNDPSEKLNRIRMIKAAGFEVGHVIHRHGMDDDTSYEVEAALIDAYPGLTNEVAGAGSNDFGAMHAREVVRKYEAKVALFDHRVLLINVNQSVTEQSLYEATRYAWKVSVSRARKAELVLAVRQGVIVEVYVPEKWLPATAENFQGRCPVPGRYGFEGKLASQAIRKKYHGKRIPDQHRKKGAANPIRYTYS